MAGGVKTEKGYKVFLRIADNLNIQEPFALEKRDFIGISMGVTGADGGDPSRSMPGAQEVQTSLRPRDQYANSLMILDLKNQLKGESVVNAGLYPPQR